MIMGLVKRCLLGLRKIYLRRVDFVANAEKSIWEPSQSIVWLGVCWNSLNGTICITERRLNKIFDHIKNITNNFTSCPRDNLQAK